MGGFNYGKICWNTWSTSSNESSIDFKFIECIRDCYLFQHVNKPTRGRFNQDPHVLDLILTNAVKTKVVIFRNRGNIKSEEKCHNTI
jgi:hypothetical protein